MKMLNAIILFILPFFLINVLNAQQVQDSLGYHAVFKWDDESLPDKSAVFSYSDCWGYAQNGREYAIIGSAAFIHIWDITNPATATEVYRLEGGDTTAWREFKTFQNRLYAVSDKTDEGLRVFDLSQLPDTVLLSYHDTTYFKSAHMLFIDEGQGRLYITGSDTQKQGIIILDIASNPDMPQLLSSVFLPLGNYVHDIYVRNNIAYCSHGYKGLYVWDMNDPLNPQIKAAFNPQNGYNHSGWLNDAGNLYVNAVETEGSPLMLLDVSNAFDDDINIISLMKEPLLAPVATDMTYHNPYMVGDKVYVSAYEDGIQVFDISNPALPQLTAFYDTYPQNNNTGLYTYPHGCWGIYPFLPSGNLIVSDIQNGLFILAPNNAVTNQDIDNTQKISVQIFPNPANDYLHLQTENNDKIYSVEIFDLIGNSLYSTSFQQYATIDIRQLPAGVYNIHINNGSVFKNDKFIKY